MNRFLDAGILPIGGGLFFLSRKIGSGKAYELLTLKREYGVSEAIKYGLVDKIVPLKDLTNYLDFEQQEITKILNNQAFKN